MPDGFLEVGTNLPRPEQVATMSAEEVNAASIQLSAIVDPIQDQIDKLKTEIGSYGPLQSALLRRSAELTAKRFEIEDSQSGKILLRRCCGEFNEKNVAWSAQKYPKPQVFDEFYSVPRSDLRDAYTIVKTHTFGTRDNQAWELESGKQAFMLAGIFGGLDTRDYLHPDDLRCLRETQGR